MVAPLLLFVALSKGHPDVSAAVECVYIVPVPIQNCTTVPRVPRYARADDDDGLSFLQRSMQPAPPLWPLKLKRLVCK